MHLAPLIRDLAVILGVAGLMSLFFQRIRQPVVLGYIIAGIIVGPYTPPFQLVTDVPSIRTWAELGVVFLMFSLGLEFSFRKLARVGVSAGVTAGTEVCFFLPVGFLVGKMFGWSVMDSIFLGAMLSVSSTTIIIKALDELKLKTHRFAELIFAVLIVEDLIAILLLVALSTVATTQTIAGWPLLMAALRLVLVVGGWFIAGYFVVPRFMRYVGKVGNNELITLLSLGLCLALVVFATHFRYSTALGAFIMGSILAESSELHRIEERMESLRDLFGAVFFVSIGMLIDPKVIWEYRGTVAVICAVTILGKILSTSFGALISGQTFKNSIRVGFGLAQIGEFSFIIAGLGTSMKVTSDFIYPIAVAVSLITTFTTPYLIRVSGSVADVLERRMPPRLLEMLNRYALSSEERRAGGERSRRNLSLWLRWSISGLITSVIFVLCGEFILPRVRDLSPIFGWGAAVTLSSPFIWSMLFTFKKTESADIVNVALSRFFTLVWIGVMSFEFFPAKYVALITTMILLAGLGLFYRSMETSYLWFEKKFLSTFDHPEEKGVAERLSHLAPWDAHLVKIEVHPNSNIAMKKLSDAGLRKRCGVTVVAIQRGYETFVSPKPEELIRPRDELIVLGTDEQVEMARKEIEAPPELRARERPEVSYELRSISLPNQSPFGGRTIRNSGIRDRYRSVVVGVEREGTRLLNPDSDFQLRCGDDLWVVGTRDDINRIRLSIAEAPEPRESRPPSSRDSSGR